MCLASPECYTRVIHMALARSRPHKHPKTGVYWVRKRVPADLVPVVDKAEVTRSLGTKDAAEAKRRYRDAVAEIEEQWANLRGGEQTLTEREAHALESVRELMKGVPDVA
jgi:hypothetical protein